MDKTGVRDTSRYVPVHDLAYKIGRGLCQVLLAVHTLTGCDYTSKFGTKHVALKANPEKYLLQFGTMNDIDRQVVVAEEYLVHFSRSHKPAAHLTSFGVICTTLRSVHV